MISFETIQENFYFMILEVKNQVYNTFDFLNSPEPELYEKIISKDDYIDNLKNVIESKCFSRILPSSGLVKKEINKIRAIHTITVNLERIGDFCVNVAEQMKYLSDYKVLYGFDYDEMLTEILRGLSNINAAMRKNDLALTLDICRTENNLDKMYKVHFDHVLGQLSEKRVHPGDYITILFIVRYLERIGDSLLNIGEAILFDIIGEKIKINQFQALQQNLDQTGFEGPISEVDFQGIWGSRSGCRIGRINDKQTNPDSARGSIFKEGAINKISKERENLNIWQEKFPGVVPKVFSYQQSDSEDKASMLIEFLPGCTLDEEILTAELNVLKSVYADFEAQLAHIWENTIRKEKTPTDYVNQFRSRRNAVLQVHPEFRGGEQRMQEVRVKSISGLLDEAAGYEAETPSPLSILIHGDFNVNNIVYEQRKKTIHFIDMYRSRQYDYIQDVSVFLISNFRMPIFDSNLRTRLNWVIEKFYSFAKSFADKHEDTTFDARLSLALARSFYTSTRFELNKTFANEMFLRARFLLEKLCLSGKKQSQFRIPKEILFY
ncbi:MAG: PhoU domain-containing protein [Desulfonatronovibrionaceae bacterium]